MTQQEILEWSFTATGLLGAGLLATYSKYAPWGWVAFLVTNVLTMAFAHAHGFWGLFVQQSFFCITSVIGIHRSGLGRAQETDNSVDAWLNAFDHWVEKLAPPCAASIEFDLWWNNEGKLICGQIPKSTARKIWQASKNSASTAQEVSKQLPTRRIKAIN